MPSKPCVTCSKWYPIFSEGRCRNCFAVWAKAQGYPDEAMPPLCKADACDDYAVKLGFCDRHYRRFKDHGHTDKVRQVGDGERQKHPYYNNWIYFRRQGVLCDEWHDFDTFIACVGERPSDRHRLWRKDMGAVYGPDNFEWRQARFERAYSGKSPEETREYKNRSNALRREIPKYWVKGNLKKLYNITVEQYDELLAAQGGTCAVCDKTEDLTPQGEHQLLAVDHDHATYEIRGLLCRNHNMLLGLACDDPTLLEKAAAYLRKPLRTGWYAPRAGDELAPKTHGFRQKAPEQCTVEGCEHAPKARGLCPTHYARFIRNGHAELKTKVKTLCVAPDCDRYSVARGLCAKHYERLYRTGSLEPSSRGNRNLQSSRLVCDNTAIFEADRTRSQTTSDGHVLSTAEFDSSGRRFVAA